MVRAYSQIFSEYDIKQWGIQFADDPEATIMDTLGSAEESMEVRTVTKQKRNMPWKTRTKATGSGEVKITAHVRTDIYAKMFGMLVDGYKDGVMVYGTMSVHDQFCMTERVEDEDGIEKLKAYPCCTLKEGLSRKIETNGEEVAEIEFTVAVDPDNDGNGMYEVVIESDTDADMIRNWMTDFDAELCKIADPKTQCKIISFTVGSAAGVINEVSRTVNVEVPKGTGLTALTPTIVVSSGASVLPASGSEQDFTSPVTYTVTAADGETTQQYTVTVIEGE